MKKVKIGKREFNIEESWAEVSFERFNALRRLTGNEDELLLMSTFLEITVSELKQLEEPDADLIFWEAVEWWAERISVNDLEMPKSIKIGDQKIDIPKDLGFKSFHQKILATDKLKTLKSEDLDDMTMPYIIAVYLYPLYYDEMEFTDEDVTKFMNEVILKQPYLTMFPIGNFFFKRLTDSMNVRINSYLRDTPKKKGKRG